METSKQPHFRTPLKRTIYRYPTHEPCTLFSLDPAFTPTPDDIRTHIAITNEPLLYQRLFKERCHGTPYNQNNSDFFFSWARDGWLRNERFAFMVKDSENKLCACIDIQSNNLQGAEVGYWASAHKRGLMTNMVNELCTIAYEGGYQRLYLLIIPDNTPSLAVAQRANFIQVGEEERNGKHYHRFVRDLDLR